MSLKINSVYLIVFVFVCKELKAATSVNNYGPYRVDYDNCEICAGPKSKNVTQYTLEMIRDGDDYILNLNISVLLNCHINEIKITIYTLKEDKKSLLVNYKLSDPCHHFAVASLLEKQLYANRCVVKKGVYGSSISISEVSRTFFGTSFFYGEFLVKAILLSKQGNMLCVTINSIYTKKT